MAANNTKRNHQNYVPSRCNVSLQHNLWSNLARKLDLSKIKPLATMTNFHEL